MLKFACLELAYRILVLAMATFPVLAAIGQEASRTPTADARKEATATGIPRVVVAAASTTPDVSQRGLPNGHYCAPCAAANVLMSFRAIGKLQFQTCESPEHDTPVRELAIKLGDERHMQTGSRQGTNRYRLVNGLQRFLSESGQDSLSIHYAGVRDYQLSQIAPEFRSTVKVSIAAPQARDIKRGLAAGSGVIILFGSYKLNPVNGRLERLGGHYVSAVGYGVNPAGNEDPRQILLHDSNDRHTGAKFVQTHLVEQSTELWSDGELLIRSDQLVGLRSAPIKKDGRVAFLETVLVMQ